MRTKVIFLKLKSDLKKKFSSKKNINLLNVIIFQIANYMRSSDIIVLPSLHEEQYGRVIQEGIACGNVAVGSNIGAIPEIIKDRSLFV